MTSSSRLTVFVSSTIKDFGPVRRDLKAWLEGRGINARLSEHNDFPVARGVHSHDACLAAIPGSNLYVLLVGERYGGRYKGTPKSITWREYDEAFGHEIPMVALVLRSTNDQAIELAKARASGNEARLTKLKEELPRDFENVAKLIDTLRKGHRDNWIYMDWDGSLSGATEIIQQTLNNLICDYQGPYQELVRGAQHAAARAAALRDLQAATFELSCSVERGEQPVSDALGRLLALAASARTELFKFDADDVWNLMLYRRDGEMLVPWVRHCDRRIERQERRWMMGEGHVGLAASARTTLIAGDLPLADGFVSGKDADAHNYRSAVSVPLFGLPLAGGVHVRKEKDKEKDKPRNGGSTSDALGAFVITSSRLDHFLEPHQPEVLTAEQVCFMLRTVATAAMPRAVAADGARELALVARDVKDVKDVKDA